MGWWAEFTGKAGARRAQEAAANANKLLVDGYGRAGTTLDEQRLAQLGFVGSGYDAAQGRLDTAETGARNDLNTGYDRSRGDIDQYYGAAAGNVEDYYNRTQNILDPYVQRGNELADLYSTAMGAYGAEDQADFYDNYASNDPFRAYRDELANKELQSQFNARGQSGSGRFTQAVSRASLERGSADLNGYLDRLSQAGQAGQQAAGQLANIASNTGNTLAGINTRRGDQLSGIEQNRGTGLANLGSNYGLTRANFEVGRGQNMANVEGAYGNTKIGLQTGLATAQGNNLIGGAQGANQARMGGMNNLLGLGSAVIGAFTPGKGGASALGNLFGGKWV